MESDIYPPSVFRRRMDSEATSALASGSGIVETLDCADVHDRCHESEPSSKRVSFETRIPRRTKMECELADPDLTWIATKRSRREQVETNSMMPKAATSQRTHDTLKRKSKLDSALSFPFFQPVWLLLLLALHWGFAVWRFAFFCAAVVSRIISWSFARRTLVKNADRAPPLISIPTGLPKYPTHLSAILRPSSESNSLALSVLMLTKCGLECRSSHLSVYTNAMPWFGETLEEIVGQTSYLVAEREARLVGDLGYSWIEIFVGLGGIRVATLGASASPRDFPAEVTRRTLKIHLLSYENDSLPYVARTATELLHQNVTHHAVQVPRPSNQVTWSTLAVNLNPSSIPDPCAVLIYPELSSSSVNSTSSAHSSSALQLSPQFLRPPAPPPPSSLILSGYPPYLLRTTQTYAIAPAGCVAARLFGSSEEVSAEGVSAWTVAEALELFGGSKQRFGK
ncbi:hypothetical protein M427DRAFT_56473 [Gonapodya prolifera JEL478]|uniref:Uncharacterized protein n=1 Tax=Gonapodya prolifera (strain JEL478) TaxID=1344416 RepID=A0A139AGN3_GONPJ|nr:hypothetical protein M427DRAFT_56473 [Gonapodya prolifera JEL478]|eukprot:KXS15910.1 hypothetical protein M427DRAFT_56473 [Gonapodya prolifera JEL478]